jgi:hypothetical protein
MKYFLDTEFIERGSYYPLELLSVGIVAEDDRTLYIVNNEADLSHANAWVRQNVLPHLRTSLALILPLSEIRYAILNFVGKDEHPQFIAYYADYDWVVFCQIFGTMIDLPAHFPKYCWDLKQRCMDLGNPRLPQPSELGETEHNALADARWNKRMWELLDTIEFGPEADAAIRERIQELNTMVVSSGLMRRFVLDRVTDISGVSGTGVVAHGCHFVKSGKVAICWDTATISWSLYDSLDDAIAVHGHGGATTVVWIDPEIV